MIGNNPAVSSCGNQVVEKELSEVTLVQCKYSHSFIASILNWGEGMKLVHATYGEIPLTADVSEFFPEDGSSRFKTLLNTSMRHETAWCHCSMSECIKV